jgi:Flp pilus assembly pilin Flp
VRARDRERGERRLRRARPTLRARASRGSSSVEYGLLIALIGAVLCFGIGLAVKSMFLPVINCFISNIQGVTDPACADPGGSGGGGGGSGPVGPAITPGPSPAPKPTPTATPTPTASPTP